jgi:hypothetical protein
MSLPDGWTTGPTYGDHPTFTGPQVLASSDTHRVLKVADNFNKPFATRLYVEHVGQGWTRQRVEATTLVEAIEAIEASSTQLPAKQQNRK